MYVDFFMHLKRLYLATVKKQREVLNPRYEKFLKELATLSLPICLTQGS